MLSITIAAVFVSVAVAVSMGVAMAMAVAMAMVMVMAVPTICWRGRRWWSHGSVLVLAGDVNVEGGNGTLKQHRRRCKRTDGWPQA